MPGTRKRGADQQFIDMSSVRTSVDLTAMEDLKSKDRSEITELWSITRPAGLRWMDCIQKVRVSEDQPRNLQSSEFWLKRQSVRRKIGRVGVRVLQIQPRKQKCWSPDT